MMKPGDDCTGALHLTEEMQRVRYEAEIDAMDHLAVCSFWRFAKSEHPIIQTPELWARFKARFDSFGGFTPEISKRIGLG